MENDRITSPWQKVKEKFKQVVGTSDNSSNEVKSDTRRHGRIDWKDNSRPTDYAQIAKPVEISAPIGNPKLGVEKPVELKYSDGARNLAQYYQDNSTQQ